MIEDKNNAGSLKASPILTEGEGNGEDYGGDKSE
jgi:hypothetical protein